MPRLIGTRSESSLHRDLKFHYTGPEGQTEAEVAGFVADGINVQGEFIEVQTGSFGPLKKKVNELVRLGKVRIIYPVILTKYIEVYDTVKKLNQGKFRSRRKSPKRGSIWDIFSALVYAPEMPLIPHLVIELALVDAAEQRVRDGKGARRRKGISIKDRRLLAIHERVVLAKLADYLRFVPFKASEQFTSAQLAEKAEIRIDSARETLYVLSKMGIVKKCGKQGNALIYQKRPISSRTAK